MYCSPARWTRVVTAAALLSLPLAASAQTTAAPAQAPAPQDPKVDAAAAKQHLSEARDTLSQLTSMPEAARLQGDARTQVSQVISNFNELITTQSEWRSVYAKVDANLTALLGPESPNQPAGTGVTGAVGTSGVAGAPENAAAIDPGIRAKLVEFRTHLKEFERAAGGNSAAPMAAEPTSANPTSANPTSANPTSANPTSANPTSANPTSANPTSPASAATVSPASPTANMPAADQAKAAQQVDRAEADKHLDAISAILNDSKTGGLTKAQTAELKKHVAELRQLLQQSK
jgi:hypothetical protein